jgi:hypothetical protein
MKQFCFIFLFFVNNINGQVKEFVIKDSISNEIIPFCTVDFLNKYGSFSNEKGFISIPLSVDSFRLTAIGYYSKIINLKEFKSVIFLKPKIIELKEVIVKNNYKLKKHYKKMNEHKDFLQSFMPSISLEIAFFIPYKPNSNLKKIEIPVFKKGHPAIGEKAKYKNLVKIEILACKDSLPSNNLFQYKDIFKIDSDSIKNKIEYTFKEEITLPNEGLFITLTFLGQFDKNNNPVLELPFYYVEKENIKYKVTKQIEPFFPLIESKNSNTFTRLLFNNPNWKKINQSSINNVKDKNEYSNFNIEIGYEILEIMYD